MTGELANYRDYLDHLRRTLARQCEGLSPEQLATRAVPPSNLSLLGLVRHLAYVEHHWFQRVAQARTKDPRPFKTRADRDLDFNGAVGTQECVDEGFTEWRRQISLADAWLDRHDDDTMATPLLIPGHRAAEAAQSAPIRDVLVHLIEEYARHCGHADLLRECLDGRTGVRG